MRTARILNLRNRIEPASEFGVAVSALEQPAFGQVRVFNELRQRGIFVSPSGPRSIWLGRLPRQVDGLKLEVSAFTILGRYASGVFVPRDSCVQFKK